eukprot:UN20584
MHFLDILTIQGAKHIYIYQTFQRAYQGVRAGACTYIKFIIFSKITHKKYRISAVNFFQDDFLARERFGARCRFQI